MLQDNFIVAAGSHPIVVEKVIRKQISIETFAIITHLTNVFPYWEQHLGNDVIARDVIRLSKKYYPFLEIDKKKFAAVLKDRVS